MTTLDTNNPATWRSRIRDIDCLPGDWAGRIDSDGNVWLYLSGLNMSGIPHRGVWDGSRVVWSTRPPYRKLADMVNRMVPHAIGGGE